MSDAPPISNLSKVDGGAPTVVAVVGELHSATPAEVPRLRGSVAVCRTDVGYVLLIGDGGDPTQRFRSVKQKIFAGMNLRLKTAEGWIALDARGLQLEMNPKTAVRCETPPPGFESVVESRWSAGGTLARCDNKLLPGDRVELVGPVERISEGYRDVSSDCDFRTVGEFELRDLSMGGLTSAEERASERKTVIVVTVIAALAAIGLLALFLSGP